MKLKRYKNFLSESSIFNQYQGLKELLYSINEHGPYSIGTQNWYIFDEKNTNIGSYYMFIDNNKNLVIDKLNFKDIVNEDKGPKIDHSQKFMDQLTKFCSENKIIATVSPDRIIDRKKRKKVKDFYLKHGFISNTGKNLKTSITETMYKPL